MPPPSSRALAMDANYEMRGSRHRAAAETMDSIITFGDGRIFQGGWAAAHDLKRLRENNVHLLINCTTNVSYPSWHRERGTPEVITWAVCGEMVQRYMDEGKRVLPLLEPLFNEIQCYLADRKNVMIHCRAGIHRAGTMGVILAMEFLNLNAKDAVRHVQRHRRATSVLGDLWAFVLRVAEEMEWRRPPSAAPAAPPATAQERSAAPASPPSYWERIPAAPAAPATQQQSAAPAAPPGLRLTAAPAAPGPGVTLVSLSSSESESESDDEESATPHDHQRSSVILRPAEQPSSLVVALRPKWPSPAAPAAPEEEEQTSPAAPAAAEEDEQTSPAAPAAAEEEQQTDARLSAISHRLFMSCYRLSYADATGRLLFMSWNAGWGARNLAEIIDTRGYHVVAVQEARPDFLNKLDRDRWSYEIKYGQFVGARYPNWVESHMGEEIKNKICWHFATVHFEGQQRVGRNHLGILSVHLNNHHAKKPQAGPDELARAIDEASNSSHTVDIICGDLNMARWKSNEHANWNDKTLSELEMRGFMPVADYVKECCFVAVHDSIAQSLHIKGSSWGEQTEKLDPEQREAFHKDFLKKVGAKTTSQDVHWPMSLALRVATSERASGLRQRTPEAKARRNEKKRQRGYFPWQATSTAASSSGSAARAARADLASDSGWYGRSSGSSSSWNWHSWHGRSSGSGGEWSGSSWYPNWHSRSSWY